jgi:hypothetical protein
LVSTAVTVYKPESFAVLSTDIQDVMEVIQDNLGSDGIRATALPKIKVPGSGGTTWEIPTVGGVQEVKSFDAIIVFRKDPPPKAWWKLEFSGAGQTPDCYSDDGEIGYYKDAAGAIQSRYCDDCPMNEFGFSRTS